MKPVENLVNEFGVDIRAFEFYDGQILKLANPIDEELETLLVSYDKMTGNYFWSYL